LAGALHKEIGEDIDLLVEPGRSLVAPVGLTLYRIVTVKQTARVYVAVDGGRGSHRRPGNQSLLLYYVE
jgi:diaminopimelate decarboxylase